MNIARALCGCRPLDQADWLELQICLNWQLWYYIRHCHLLLLKLKADTHFTIPRRTEGWVGPVACHMQRWFTCPQTVISTGSDRAWCRVSLLISHHGCGTLLQEQMLWMTTTMILWSRRQMLRTLLETFSQTTSAPWTMSDTVDYMWFW